MKLADNKYFQFLLLTVLIYFVVFIKLDSFHIRWWDESIYAVNAYEMMENGKLFSPHFDGVPDNFNTKPPLLLWVLLGFIKLFGYNELAVRLPSAIAAALTIFLVFSFLRKRNLTWAWASVLVLITSWGFIHFHTARTGDSDALLTFFLLAANLNFLDFLSEGRKKYIPYFFLFVLFAFLTKMFAAFLFIPAWMILLTWKKRWKDFLLNLQFWVCVTVFLSVVVAVFLLREKDSPGYLHETFSKDAARLFKTIEDHKESATFYLRNFAFTRFSFWFVLLLIGMTLSFLKNSLYKNVLVSSCILVLCHFLCITISTTKLEWYEMPLYPFLAIISGFTIYWIIDKLEISSLKYRICTMGIIFIYPYCAMFDKAQANAIPLGERKLEANEIYIFKKLKTKKDLNGIKIYYSKHKGGLLFYKYRLGENGQKIELTDQPVFKINDKVLVSNDSLKAILDAKYRIELDDFYDFAHLYRIAGVKN